MTNIFVSPNLESLSILYVEDDQETRDELDLILRLCVGNLYIATNGREGLDMYKRYLPDIVITDIQMPEMNGLAMAAEIKKLDREQAIVILSAYNDVEYIFRALELGIENYITKPIRVERLLDKLTEITARMALTQEVHRNRTLLSQYKMLVDEKAVLVKFNTQGNISYVNRHFCALTGYTEDELLNLHYTDPLISDISASDCAEICQQLNSIHKWQGMRQLRTKNNAKLVVDISAIAICVDDSRIEEYVVLMLDMSEAFDKFKNLSFNQTQTLGDPPHFLLE